MQSRPTHTCHFQLKMTPSRLSHMISYRLFHVAKFGFRKGVASWSALGPTQSLKSCNHPIQESGESPGQRLMIDRIPHPRTFISTRSPICLTKRFDRRAHRVASIVSLFFEQHSLRYISSRSPDRNELRCIHSHLCSTLRSERAKMS